MPPPSLATPILPPFVVPPRALRSGPERSLPLASAPYSPSEDAGTTVVVVAPAAARCRRRCAPPCCALAGDSETTGGLPLALLLLPPLLFDAAEEEGGLLLPPPTLPRLAEELLLKGLSKLGLDRSNPEDTGAAMALPALLLLLTDWELSPPDA